MSAPLDLGIDSSVRLTEGDLVRCPSCHNNTHVKTIGIVHMGDLKQDLYNCNNCNRLFSKVDGGVRQILDEAVQKVPINIPISFSSTVASTVSVVNTSNGTNTHTYQNDNEIKDELERVRLDSNQRLEQLNSTFYTFKYSIENLMATIQDLAQKNHDLQQKIATDPLQGIRKSILDFNLK